MNKKIFFLVIIQVCIFATTAFAQPCTNPLPSCVTNQHIDNSGADWYTSHGALSTTSSNSPTSPTTTGSLSFWSMLNDGNGAFTCFDFQQGVTYRVCFWVRNISGSPGTPSNPWGRLYVYAANNLNDTPPNSIYTPPGANKQLIDQSYYGPPKTEVISSTGFTKWEFISTTFTANNDYNCLWLYALNPEGVYPYPGPIMLGWSDYYQIEVDDIRVMVEPSTPYSLSALSVTDPIDACPASGNGSTQVDISGMPTGAVADWFPSTGVTLLSPFDGTSVIVSPCSTTTYKIVITDPTAPCGNCIREVLYHTVNVTPWSDPANIIYPSSEVDCTTPFDLDYNDPGTCTGVLYRWIDPQGGFHPPSPATTALQSFTADALHTGEWTLQIFMPGKGCAEEHKILVNVGSCCKSYPDFTYSVMGNQVTFNHTGSGIINHVGTLWSFGDGTTSDQLNPVHTYTVSSNITYIVCMTTLYEDGQGESCCNRKCDAIVFPEMISPTGPGTQAQEKLQPPAEAPTAPVAATTGDINQFTGLTVYPNPNQGNFSLSLGKRTGKYNVIVRDQLGREVYTHEHVFSNVPVKVELKDLAAGIYAVEVLNEKEKFVQQISITK